MLPLRNNNIKLFSLTLATIIFFIQLFFVCNSICNAKKAIARHSCLNMTINEKIKRKSIKLLQKAAAKTKTLTFCDVQQ